MAATGSGPRQPQPLPRCRGVVSGGLPPRPGCRGAVAVAEEGEGSSPEVGRREVGGRPGRFLAVWLVSGSADAGGLLLSRVCVFMGGRGVSVSSRLRWALLSRPVRDRSW